MNALDLIGPVLGATGTALGVVTAARQFLDDSVRLRVNARRATIAALGVRTTEDVIVFSVVNLSRFPVTVTMLGLETDDPVASWYATNPRVLDGGSYPRRIDPRDGFSVSVAEAGKAEEFLKITRPFADTLCGEHVRGPRRDGRVLRAWAQEHARVTSAPFP